MKRINLKKNNSGMVMLPMVIFIGGIIVELAIATALITYFILQMTSGNRNATQALAMAQTGIDDVMISNLRDKNFPNIPVGGSPYVYQINTDTNHYANITVCKDYKYNSFTGMCDSANLGQTEITVLGSAFNRKRRLQVYIIADPITGEVIIKSFQEISL